MLFHFICLPLHTNISTLEKKNKCSFLTFDHVAVCAMMVVLGKILLYISGIVSIFDPMKAAFDDFHLTDIFFEIQQNADSNYDNDIVIVDMTDLRTRDEIAQAITDIKSCKPKILGIDLIFERPNFYDMDDVALVSALTTGDCQQVLSCKLRDYSVSEDSFKDCLYSFFREAGDFEWGYTNYYQTRMGGLTRETSQSQLLNDSAVYSFSYLLACQYTDRPLVEKAVNKRQIMYSNVKFHVIGSNEIAQNADKLRGKLVLLGAAKEETDMHFTPIGKMPGIEVIAYSITSYLRHGEIVRMDKTTSLLLAFVFCYIAAWMGYIMEKKSPIFFAILAKLFNFFLMAVLIGVAFYAFFDHDYFIELLYPLVGLTLVEDVRELYAGIIKWMAKTFHWECLSNSLYV